MIDGGAGQVSVARQALAELGHASVPIVGLAKKHEELYLPERSEPIRAPLEHPGLMILTRLRDEAHRFALRFHRTVRAKRFTLSDLDNIPGLGSVKRRELLRRFGSVEALLRVDELALAQEPHIGIELARQIQTALKRKR
jgi:excinuclease ABC subunit C